VSEAVLFGHEYIIARDRETCLVPASLAWVEQTFLSVRSQGQKGLSDLLFLIGFVNGIDAKICMLRLLHSIHTGVRLINSEVPVNRPICGNVLSINSDFRIFSV